MTTISTIPVLFLSNKPSYRLTATFSGRWSCRRCRLWLVATGGKTGWMGDMACAKRALQEVDGKQVARLVVHVTHFTPATD